MAEHSHKIVEGLNQSGILPYEVVWKPTLITNALIRKTFEEANMDETCAGVITWMHTFSPAKSWIIGLQEYRKPHADRKKGCCRTLGRSCCSRKDCILDAYPVNEIAQSVDAVSEADVNTLVEEYYDRYEILLEGRDEKEFRKHVAVQAQIEIGFERFLEEKNYQAIVTHFGDLGALKQLPGLAIQRLMEKGYGFGAEGDWKVAAMVRLMKIMTGDLKNPKGTSMLEDYTYNLVKGKEGILEAHMLEICPSIAEGPISIKCNPLSMGDREDPARLVFTSKEGPGIATSLIDLGNRFRLIINDVECKKVERPMPKLPVATNFWTPKPDMYTGAEAWILAGGAHHTAFTYDLTAEQMGDWAAAMGIEAVYIDKETKIRDFKRDLMLGEVFYK